MNSVLKYRQKSQVDSDWSMWNARSLISNQIIIISISISNFECRMTFFTRYREKGNFFSIVCRNDILICFQIAQGNMCYLKKWCNLEFNFSFRQIQKKTVIFKNVLLLFATKIRKTRLKIWIFIIMYYYMR